MSQQMRQRPDRIQMVPGNIREVFLPKDAFKTANLETYRFDLGLKNSCIQAE